MSELKKVGISDYAVSRAPDIVVTYALGSCVGICLYDSAKKIGGLSHIMLPESSMAPRGETNRMKFADTAITDIARDLKNMGALRLTAKIAGGAQMFATQAMGAMGNIGERNVKAVKTALAALRIPIIAEDTGRDYGRTVFFDLATGIMKVQSIGKSTHEL
ncbi:MAG: chemotaxis protein CheD [Clostridiales Family XIII bacterium]|jgi:chemotaxis protein CheD|nr:chemotaxis protein CheD [Clostridiales Family XIII bacterium]